ncbi:MAG: hypothetical protein HY717_12620 [Planctomycetes bacterium]|nr:hypothetical protein [Planctomycetota bacterium]
MTHIEYLKQLIEMDERDIARITAGSEISVSGSSEPDAVARWIAREWALCEGFAIVKFGLPFSAVQTWRQNGEEIIQFQTGLVHVSRTGAGTLRLRIFFNPIIETIHLGPVHDIVGRLSQRSGRHVVTRPLTSFRPEDPGARQRLAGSPQPLIRR